MTLSTKSARVQPTFPAVLTRTCSMMAKLFKTHLGTQYKTTRDQSTIVSVQIKGNFGDSQSNCEAWQYSNIPAHPQKPTNTRKLCLPE